MLEKNTQQKFNSYMPCMGLYFSIMGIRNVASASLLRSDDSMINQIDRDYQEASCHVIDVTFAL